VGKTLFRAVGNSCTCCQQRHPSSCRSTVLNTFQTPLTFMILTIGGGGGGCMKSGFPPRRSHLMWHSHKILDPPLQNPLATYPPFEISPNHYPIPLTSLCHRTLLPLAICPILHTRYPIKTLPMTINCLLTTLRHNEHLQHTVKHHFIML
jgi:hypothetical protein